MKHPLKVMIWGCFNFNGVGRIEVCEGTMNQSKYLETLESSLKPSINDLNPENQSFNLDDSARPHRPRKFMNGIEIETLDR